jgi:hypothetical protein
MPMQGNTLSGGNGDFDSDQPAGCLVCLCLIDLAYTEDSLGSPGAGQAEKVSHLRRTIADTFGIIWHTFS